MRSFSYPSILRGARTVMSEHDAFDRVLAAVHAATLDETRWPATSALIDEACGLTGNGLMVAEGPTNDVRALFVGLYARGQRRGRALLHESERARIDPDPRLLHRPMRYDIGLPSPVI